MATRRFEFAAGTSRKFWEVSVAGMIEDFFMLRHEQPQKRFDAVKSELTKIAAKRG